MKSNNQRWPDFLIIGAPKSGTTALYMAVSRHPQVFVSTPKEPRYFAYLGSRPHFSCPGGERSADGVVYDLEEYLRLFRPCGSDQRAGEASAVYLQHPNAPANAHARIPSARVVALLRHPVERAFSAWLHMRHHGVEELADFEAAVSAEARRKEQGWRPGWRYLGAGCYGSQLQRWLQYYPREQLLVLFYEDWKAHPLETLRRVFAHIGVDDGESVPVTREHVTSLQPRWSWLHHRLVRDSALRRWSQRHLPHWIGAAVTQSIGRFNLRPGPRLDPRVKDRLAGFFDQEIDLLESLTGRDLRHWRSPA